MRYFRGPDDLLLPAESKALELIAEIKSILDDEAIEDPECFCKIDALVDAFHAKGIPTARHDW